MGCGSLSLYVILRLQRSEISSVAHQPSCFALKLAFAVLVYYGLVSLPCPLSLWQGQWSISGPLAFSELWWFAVWFSVLRAVWLWVLLSGSGDELCGPLSALLHTWAYHPPAVGLPAFPAICLLIICVEITFLPLPPSLVCFQSSCPLCCVLVFSLLFIVQIWFFFLHGGSAWSVCPGAYAGFSQVWLVLTCFGCLMSP
jgi:hypothetical protein